jgi:glucans biosynthesis protein
MSVQGLRDCRLVGWIVGVVFGLRSFAQGAALPLAEPSTFVQLQQAAQQLSGQPWQPQRGVPDVLRNLTYDQFRLIGFIDGKEIWANDGRPFRIGFYHRGHVHCDDVAINLVVDGRSRHVPFSREYFHYLNSAKDLPVPADLGFAGFRVWSRFPGRKDFEEIFTFVGASYFRARAGQTVLGTSARGLALDCGLPESEEFPVFREYWISEPASAETSLRVLALLDSPSVAGAYEFILTPGIESSDCEIRETLYFRQTPRKVGVAPLSSMWMWGDGLSGPPGDHRPEVHDADGLQIQLENGKWTWRALCRQAYPSIVKLKSEGLQGFGSPPRPSGVLASSSCWNCRRRMKAWTTLRSGGPPSGRFRRERPSN